MKTILESLIIVSFFLCICLVNSVRADVVNFEDGGYYSVSDAQYQDDFVFLDNNTINNPGTHLELVDDGSIYYVNAYHNSSVVINGGSIEMELRMQDNSTANINGGSIGGLWAGGTTDIQINNGLISYGIEMMGSSTTIVNGGTIDSNVQAWENSTIEICGGTISQLLALGNGTIYLYGTEFMVGNHVLSYGDSLRNYGTINGNEITGTITGKLQDDSILSNTFTIYGLDTNADIIVIPEPASLLLLGAGGLVLRKRKS